MSLPRTDLPRRQKPSAPLQVENAGTVGESSGKNSTEIKLTPEEKEYVENVIKKRPVEFKEYLPGSDTGRGGLVIGILSLWKGRKSVTAGLFSFFNSAFKDKMGPKTARVLSSGRLPEIQKVLFIDTEDSTQRDLNHGFLGMMLKPVHDAGMKIYVENTPLLRKREKVKDGEVINVSKEYDVDKMRENFEAAVWKAADYGEGTLVIVDSMSDYKDSITDEQEEMFGKTIITDYKAKEGTDDENVNMDRKFYRYRNKWWTNILMKLRNSGAWVVETYKIDERDEEYRWKDVKVKIGKDPKTKKWVYREETIHLEQYYPVWIKKSEYRIDQGYYIMPVMSDDGSIQYKIRTDWFKHRHSTLQFSKIPKDKREDLEINACLPYPDNDRMAMMDLIEDMAPSLLQEEIPEDNLWGARNAKKPETGV